MASTHNNKGGSVEPGPLAAGSPRLADIIEQLHHLAEQLEVVLAEQTTPTPVEPEFCELVTRRFVERPQSEEHAAATFGVSQATINRWRNARGLPEVYRYEAIAKWLGTDADTVARAVDRQRIREAREQHARRQHVTVGE